MALKTNWEKHLRPCPHCGKDVLDHMTQCPFCKEEISPLGYAGDAAPPPALQRGLRIAFWAAAGLALLVALVLRYVR